MTRTIKPRRQTAKGLLIVSLLVILLGLVNWRIDLRPNTILVQAALPEGFQRPNIRLDSFDHGGETTIHPGDITPLITPRLKSFQAVFAREAFSDQVNFNLTGYQKNLESQTHTWTGSLPPASLQPSLVDRLVLVDPLPQVDYQLKVLGTPWTLSDQDGMLTAHGRLMQVQGLIQLQQTTALTEHAGLHADLRDPTLAISALVIPNPQPLLITIERITIAKQFGQSVIRLPLVIWQGAAIDEAFSLIEPPLNTHITPDSRVTIPAEAIGPISLAYRGSLSGLWTAIDTRILAYQLALNLGLLLGALVLFRLRHLAVKTHPPNADTPPNRLTGLGELWHNQPLSGVATRQLFHLALYLLALALLFLLTFRAQGSLFLRLTTAAAAVALLASRLPVVSKAFQSPILPGVQPRTVTRIVLISLLALGVGLLFFRLGAHGFYEDEFQVVDAAGGFLNTGTWYRWDWAAQRITDLDKHTSYSARYYNRAWPHTWLVAQSFRAFGISEWSGRLPSALGGVVFLVGLVAFVRYFSSKTVAGLSLLAAVFNPDIIEIFRYTRMYALLMPLSLLTMWCLYRGLTGDWHPRLPWARLERLVASWLNFDYRYLLAGLALLYLAYLVHVNALIIAVGAYAYIYALAVVDRRRKFILLAALGLPAGALGLTGLFWLQNSRIPILGSALLPGFLHFLSPFTQRNPIYLDYLLAYPFGRPGGLLLVGLAAWGLIRARRQPEAHNRRMFLLVMALVTAGFFIFFAGRYPRHLYVAHILPIALILVLDGLHQLMRQLKWTGPILVGWLALLALGHLGVQANFLYRDPAPYGDYQTAYQVILDNYQPDQVIFGQYLRTYYLPGLDGINHISMLKDQHYLYEQFLADLQAHPTGWLAWETRKAYHLDERIIQFAEDHFNKLHGDGVDQTWFEVYHYNLPEIAQ